MNIVINAVHTDINCVGAVMLVDGEGQGVLWTAIRGNCQEMLSPIVNTPVLDTNSAEEVANPTYKKHVRRAVEGLHY